MPTQQVLWPTYVFQVNLQTVDKLSSSLPNSTVLKGNETIAEADQVKNTRSSWLASMFPGVEMVVHGDSYQFTANGQKAIYYKNTYIKGSVNDLLIRIS